eukprot:m.276702 g.276702  ORF g.276702 m.276702 type:complete len:54 (-) comp19770_c0_seq10:197-358(-)
MKGAACLVVSPCDGSGQSIPSGQFKVEFIDWITTLSGMTTTVSLQLAFHGPAT